MAHLKPVVITSNYFSALQEEVEPASPTTKRTTSTTSNDPTKKLTKAAAGGGGGGRSTRKYYEEPSEVRVGRNDSNTKKNVNLNKENNTSAISGGGEVGNWDEKIPSDRPSRGRGRGRGRDGIRGRGGGGGRGNHTNEEGRYDRHSQTNHQDTNKTEEKGWGSNEGTAEFEAEKLGLVDSIHEWSTNDPNTTTTISNEVEELAVNVDDWNFADTPTPAVEGEEGRGQVEKNDPSSSSSYRSNRKVYPQEVDNTLTYSEYLAVKEKEKEKEKFSFGELKEVRALNEGTDQLQWEGVTRALPRKGEYQEEEYYSSKKSEPKIRKHKVEKIYLVSNFEHPVPTFRGGRGGRGRGGGRGKSEDDDGSPRSLLTRDTSNLPVEDKSIFPTLV